MSKPSMREYGMLKKGLDPNSEADNAAYTDFLNAGYADPNSDVGKEVKAINKEASSVLYGTVGSSTDTRDWNAIVASSTNPTTGKVDGDKLTAVSTAATSQMYGGTAVKQIPDSISFGIYASDGTLLRVLSGSEKTMGDSLKDFGIQDNSWVSTATESLTNSINNIDAEAASLQTVLQSDTASAQQKEEAQQRIGELQATKTNASRFLNTFLPKFADSEYYAQYQPFIGYEDVLQTSYVTGLSQRIETRIEQAEEPEGTQGVVEQTIVAPDTTTVAVPQPDYTGTTTTPTATTPSAQEALPTTQQPVSTTPYTPTPTTVTGQPVSVGVAPTGVYPQAPVTGTMGAPLQTAGMGAVPQTVQVRPDYTGTTMQNLTSQSQQGFGGQRTYGNQYGQRITVTVDAQGSPLTYVPPGYTPVQGQAEGGDAGSRENEALYTIAKMNGYNGPKSGTALKAFFNSSDALKAKARAIGVAMNKGGYIKGYYPGGLIGSTAAGLLAGEEDGTENSEEQQQIPVSVEAGATIDPAFATQLAGQTKDLIGQTMTPQQSAVDYIQPQEADFIGQTAGQATAVSPMAEAATVGTVQQAQMPMMAAPATMGAITAAPSVQAETDALQAQTGVVSPQAQVAAQQQLTTSVAGMEAAQGTATMVNAPAAREIQKGEIIDGVADAEKAALFTEQVQAATATPSKQATVAGQLEGLMQQFEGGNTPPWAAGSMRTAMQTLAARGLGASSLAGQAVIQATMEAALPIAQMDAQTMAQFEAQNLSNRQQRAMLAAQQRAQFLGQEFDQAFQARVQNSARIGDIANMNFTAEQNIALENSRAANTMSLSNLSNRQAMVMAEAAALANLDMANLNNRQQAAVQNAQNFLQMDMANLNNEQQTAMFKAQQNIQALFTDQAAENAAAQFNAQSENQTNQFFANLSSQTSQFNAAQQNAMDQFNVNSVNALREFNSELQQQRDMFNAQNGLVVAQSNAQWRQNIATLNTAAQNESNMNFAKTMNAFTSTNLDAYWQRERDIMSFAFTSAENAADRMASVLLEKLSAENKATLADAQGKGTLGAVLLKGALNYMAGGKNIV
jgi:hypothetical protein